MLVAVVLPSLLVVWWLTFSWFQVFVPTTAADLPSSCRQLPLFVGFHWMEAHMVLEVVHHLLPHLGPEPLCQ